MAMICPACGHANAEAGNFCSKCAAPLGAPGTARKERKYATALFADLVGSTTLAEQEDPEVVQAAIGSVFDRLADVIDAYGGLLEKYMGDAILAVFGVPVVHEDDPERAIRAALEMHAVLSEMNRAAEVAGKPQLAMRIGIESGDILVDLERAGSTRDRMLTGDAVNVAARLQSSADIGGVLVGPTAYGSTKDTIGYSEPKILELKGKAAPVAAYTARMVAAKHAGERPSLGVESRMVGRDRELAVLQQTLHRVENEGRPALVTILAPAGSGKSRLVRELGRYTEHLDQSFFWRFGRCLPYGAAAYSALADVIKAQCEVLDDDPAEVATTKIDRSVDELGGDADTAVALKTLLGLHPDSSMGREKLFDVWRRFLERLAARSSLVLVLEDIHWADEGLLDFIEFLADWGQGAIMIVTAARPELLDRRPAWGGGKRNYAAIYLDPLGRQETDEMLTDLFGDALPTELKTLIAEHSEGNPLYTEEIVRMLIDRGMLVGSRDEGWTLATTVADITIPRSIHALIAARVDALATDEKALLQDASVVGRIFWSGIAAQLAHQDSAKTREQLGRLRLKELITPREPSSFSDEHEFGFHHALIRDVAYDSLPKKLRTDKHIEVARWAESGTSADRDDVVELIATHLYQALAYMVELGGGDQEIAALREKTFDWAIRAAERSRRVWQTARALEWYRRALDIEDQLGRRGAPTAAAWEAFALCAIDVLADDETVRAFTRAIEIYDAQGQEADAGRAKAEYSKALFQMGEEQTAVALAEEAVALLRAKNDERSLARALGGLALLYYRSAREAESEALALDAVERARRTGDRETETAALTTRGAALSMLGRVEEAIELFKISHAIADEIGNLHQLLRSGNDIGSLLIVLGDPDQAGQKILEDSLELARRHGQRTMQVFLSMNLCEVFTRQGRFAEAESLVIQALAEAPQMWVKLSADAEVFLGQLDAYRGDLEAARAHVEKARSFASTDVSVRLEILAVGALVAHFRGDDDSALDLMREATALKADEVVSYFPNVVRIAVKICVQGGRQDEAQAFRDLFEKPGSLPHAFREWCDGLLESDLVGSHRHLADAAELFERLHVPLYQAQCLSDLAVVSRDLGRDHVDVARRATDFFESCGARLLEEAARLET